MANTGSRINPRIGPRLNS